jgi:hypothetical protein
MVIAPRGEPAEREARGGTELGLPPAFHLPAGGFAPLRHFPWSSGRDATVRFQGRFTQYDHLLGYDLVNKFSNVIDLRTRA